jgi:hypothetical protein
MKRQLIDRLHGYAGDSGAGQPDPSFLRSGTLQQHAASLISWCRLRRAAAASPFLDKQVSATTGDTWRTSTWLRTLTRVNRHTGGEGDEQDRREQDRDSRLHEIRERRWADRVRPAEAGHVTLQSG